MSRQRITRRQSDCIDKVQFVHPVVATLKLIEYDYDVNIKFSDSVEVWVDFEKADAGSEIMRAR